MAALPRRECPLWATMRYITNDRNPRGRFLRHLGDRYFVEHDHTIASERDVGAAVIAIHFDQPVGGTSGHFDRVLFYQCLRNDPSNIRMMTAATIHWIVATMYSVSEGANSR